MSALSPAAAALIRLMQATPRGPRRDGIFALWLTVRVVEDLTLVPPQPERAVRRRVANLERRLSSLALPTPLRRGLAGVLLQLRDANGPEAPSLLAQLAAPARDGVGTEVGEVIGRAARAVQAPGPR